MDNCVLKNHQLRRDGADGDNDEATRDLRVVRFCHTPPTSGETLIIGEPDMLENKFERRFPTQQNAIDIFGDRRASKIREVCGPLYSQDQ